MILHLDTDRVAYTMYKGYDACTTCDAPINEPCANLNRIDGYVPLLSTRAGAYYVRQKAHASRPRSTS